MPEDTSSDTLCSNTIMLLLTELVACRNFRKVKKSSSCHDYLTRLTSTPLSMRGKPWTVQFVREMFSQETCGNWQMLSSRK